MKERLGVGIIGCGNIAGPYAADLPTYPHLHFIGAADLDPARAQTLAAQHGGKAYPEIDQLLRDPDLDLVLNLTTFQAHYEVTSKALQAGKHVFSEKPLALTYPKAQELLHLAESKGLRLGCSPFTLMGEAQQTAWKLIREGRAGQVRMVNAEVNHGRIELWHPAPQPFYEVGVVADVGVYPITLLVSMLGPVQRVTSQAKVLKADRETKEGIPYRIQTPDWWLVLLELGNGIVVRLTMNFYVSHLSKQNGIEFHGDQGSIFLSSSGAFNAAVEFAPYGEPYTPVALVRPPYEGIPWGRGAAEMAEALLAGKPHRFTGELAAHVCEILDAIRDSHVHNAPVVVRSEFTPPAPMMWAL